MTFSSGMVPGHDGVGLPRRASSARLFQMREEACWQPWHAVQFCISRNAILLGFVRFFILLTVLHTYGVARFCVWRCVILLAFVRFRRVVKYTKKYSKLLAREHDQPIYLYIVNCETVSSIGDCVI